MRESQVTVRCMAFRGRDCGDTPNSINASLTNANTFWQAQPIKLTGKIVTKMKNLLFYLR